MLMRKSGLVTALLALPVGSAAAAPADLQYSAYAGMLFETAMRGEIGPRQ